MTDQTATKAPGTAYGDNPEHHRIAAGVFECTAPADAPCRTSPTCDCEEWCCDTPADHDPGDHCCMATVQPGQNCWMEAWVNNDIDGSFDHENEIAPGEYDIASGERAWPNGAVTCDWEDYVVWRYVEEVAA